MEIGRERFEELVADALDSLPESMGRLMDNVWVTVSDNYRKPLYGLYEGTPLTERDSYGGFAVPDRISIFRLQICRDCDTEEEVVAMVRETVVHEVAHHFGVTDERLDELGWA